VYDDFRATSSSQGQRNSSQTGALTQGWQCQPHA